MVKADDTQDKAVKQNSEDINYTQENQIEVGMWHGCEPHHMKPWRVEKSSV